MRPVLYLDTQMGNKGTKKGAGTSTKKNNSEVSTKKNASEVSTNKNNSDVSTNKNNSDVSKTFAVWAVSNREGRRTVSRVDNLSNVLSLIALFVTVRLLNKK